MTSTFLIAPQTPTLNKRRIELAGIDLLIMARIDNVFVYPSEINIDRLKEALSRTLSLWPLVTGRIILENDEHYFIELGDSHIPITYVINKELKQWPLDSKVIVELNDQRLSTFIDEVQVAKLLNDTTGEPLVRLKLTRILQSNEWVLGISWYHPLGDAAACLHFSNTLSRVYQRMEPTKPLPIFERRLWQKNEVDHSVLPTMKHLRDAKPLEEVIKNFIADQSNHEPVNLHFSGEQLGRLQKLIGENNITIQDALTAYIIITLNTHCYRNNNERRILRINTTINIRGISDSIAPHGQAANALFTMLSDKFEDCYSLSSIAKAIRRSIIQVRDPKFLEVRLATADELLRNNIKNNKSPDIPLLPNEIFVNSNFKYDWANLVDFGYTDKCRFYTTWSGTLYLRIFRLNPEKIGNQWLPRDRDGAEVSFRMEKDLKETFLNAWKRDIQENFANVKI